MGSTLTPVLVGSDKTPLVSNSMMNSLPLVSANVSVSPSLISLEFAGKLRMNPFSISNVTVGLTPSLRLNVSPSANSLAACTTSVGLDISASIMVFMELATSTLDILSLIGTNAVLGLLIGSF